MNLIRNCSNCINKNVCDKSTSVYGCNDHVLTKQKPMIYVASKLRGDIEGNLKNARRYTMRAMNSNVLPLTPHLYFATFLDDTKANERKVGMDIGKEMLLQCEAVWVFGKISGGVQSEIDLAVEHGIPVYYINEQVLHINMPMFASIGNKGAVIRAS